MTTPSSSASNPRRMPPASAELATAWAFLEDGLGEIMANGPIKYSKYMTLYTVAYNYCASSMYGVRDSAVSAGNRSKYFHALLPLQREDALSDNDGDRTDDANINAAGAEVIGSELYDNLVRYFALHVKGVKEKSDRLQGEALLRYYAGEWDRYTTGANYINRLFTYLNRHWVKPAQKEGRVGVYPVYTLALVQWKSIFFLDGQNELAGIIHRLIESERNGQTINHGHIKKVIDSFISLGLDEDVNKASL
ncbi:Cullin repeat-like-containing domain protein [Boletus reticuloceps]|uniref:Cullin repeat-like-containing domain protein n=1 Tax=Boletus reticuloceps TaxID=495285 RepID=A0A8I2YRP8_9AGAM|nr:Cullin repeat-like-containing domain protein [Boletus reticuloceps]